MNRTFFNPCKDQCDLSIGFKDNVISKDEYDEHLHNKDRARMCKDVDKTLANSHPDIMRVI